MKQRDLIMGSKCETIHCSQFGNNYATITGTEGGLFCLKQGLKAGLGSVRIGYREDFIGGKYITVIARINNTIDGARKYAQEQKKKGFDVIVVGSEGFIF